MLVASPDNQALAAKAFAQAINSGNPTIARDTARTLERLGSVGMDVRLVLLADALRGRDWKNAGARIDVIEKDELFGFLAPLLRAWTAVGSGKGDPIALLDAANKNPLAASYAEEHRPLLLLASGRDAEGAAELQKLAGGTGMRDQRLRIAGAALLARKHEPKLAADLLAGEAPGLDAARQLLAAGRPIPGEVATAPAGIAELLIRIAGDLQRQNAPAIALPLARIATFMAPENSETWLVTSDILAAGEDSSGALAALANVGESDPFSGAAANSRIHLLVEAGRPQAALAEAEAAAKGNAPAATWSRLGDLYASLQRQQDAANAYGEALKRLKAGDSSEWALHLLRGGALDKAGAWPESRKELEIAYRLAPEQAVVLNYLGYSQLERRENLDEAMRLITKASSLQPDSAQITDSLGWAHYLRGNVPKAIELLERASTSEPADPAINEHLGDAYYKAGRRYEARYAWKAALIQAADKDAKRLRAKIDAGLKPEFASP